MKEPAENTLTIQRTPSENYAALESWLGAFRRRWRAAMIARGLMMIIAAASGAALVLMIGDNLLHFPSWLRICAFVASALFLVAGFALLVIRPLTLRLSSECVAARAERLRPGLDNVLINAVLLHKDRLGPLERKLAEAQLAEAAAALAAVPPRNTQDWRAMRLPAAAALALASLIIFYAVATPDAFNNALARLIKPWEYIPPLTATRLDVSPGDAEILAGESLLVEAVPSGVIPPNAEIIIKSRKAERKEKMDFEGGAFIFQLASLTSPFTYRIHAGDAVTRNYRVTIKPRPFITSVRIALRYPDYLGLPAAEQEKGDIQTVAGTEANVSIRTDSPITSAVLRLMAEGKTAEMQGTQSPIEHQDSGGRAEEIQMTLKDSQEAAAKFTVETSGVYHLLAADHAGTPSKPIIHNILALPDSPPRCEITLPGRDISIPAGQKLPVHARASDDYGIRSLALLVSQDGKQWKILQSRDYPPATGALNEAFEIDPSALGLAAGSGILYCVRALDGLERSDENAGRSPSYRLSIAEAKQDATTAQEDSESLMAGIRRIIRLQNEARDGALIIAKWESKGAEKDARRRELLSARCAETLLAQTRVRDETTSLIQRHSSPSPTVSTEGRGHAILSALATIRDREMEEAWRLADSLRKAGASETLHAAASSLADVQKIIVEKLTALLESGESAASSLLAQQKEGAAEEKIARDAARKLAEELLKKLDEFKEEQKKTFEATRPLEKKPVEDFTEADLAAIEEARQAESEWAKYFEEKVTDLSKLPPQDFADTAIAKELFEIWCEVKLAEDAFTRKNIEMAVPHEQSGLELAESLETNLEKWLMDVKDYQKWAMEEPTQDYDVPIVDLPDELEDLIGELLDSAESMADEIEDVTSGWMDSIDKGAGWGTMDGPISNMSAQGKTGNLLPNTQEIGGRSGEGRSGKSSGQFVEETATGKGGRDTPTRLTPDPFEEGAVKDTSKDPVSGSTGGGRISGSGLEGLRGPAPPQVAEQLARLAVKQAEIINKAEALDHDLKVWRYPRGGLPDAIAEMKRDEQDMRQGRMRDYSRNQKVILSSLREVKSAVERQKKINRDTAAPLPKEIRTQITDSLSEKAPAQYKEMLGNYYKTLTETR